MPREVHKCSGVLGKVIGCWTALIGRLEMLLLFKVLATEKKQFFCRVKEHVEQHETVLVIVQIDALHF